MKKHQAIAEIAVDPNRGWPLPRFGSKKADQFRYQARVHFEKDETWGQRTWTLLIDLSAMPDTAARSVDATVYFMSPDAPQQLPEEGAKFELLQGH
jgi:hypothetical protein